MVLSPPPSVCLAFNKMPQTICANWFTRVTFIFILHAT